MLRITWGDTKETSTMSDKITWNAETGTLTVTHEGDQGASRAVISVNTTPEHLQALAMLAGRTIQIKQGIMKSAKDKDGRYTYTLGSIESKTVITDWWSEVSTADRYTKAEASARSMVAGLAEAKVDKVVVLSLIEQNTALPENIKVRVAEYYKSLIA